jgi:hypothetical protein
MIIADLVMLDSVDHTGMRESSNKKRYLCVDETGHLVALFILIGIRIPDKFVG